MYTDQLETYHLGLDFTIYTWTYYASMACWS